MATHATVSSREAAGRLAIRELVDARYLDEFARQDGQWLFAERRLTVNWIETRPRAA